MREGNRRQTPVGLWSPFQVIGCCPNGRDFGWEVVIQFKGRDGKETRARIGPCLLYTDSETVIEAFAEVGFYIALGRGMDFAEQFMAESAGCPEIDPGENQAASLGSSWPDTWPAGPWLEHIHCPDEYVWEITP